MEQYDILVVGGGSAGLCAALQASRILGAGRVCLVEKNGMCGGTTTIGGVNFPGIFHAWGKQVIGGIGWELIEQVQRECGKPLPEHLLTKDTSMVSHTKFQIRIDTTVYACIADEWLVKAGTVLKYHTMVGSVQKQDSSYRVTLCGKDGLYDIEAKLLIDCTGDANLAKLAGAELNVIEDCQPGTFSCYATGYDLTQLDMPELQKNYEQAVADGKLEYRDSGWGMGFSAAFLTKHGDNANHIVGINAADSEGRTRMELAGRASLMRMFRFLKTQRGFENLELKPIASECGVRESRTIQGLQTVTVNDYISGRVFDNAVCYSFYPIDLHDKTAGISNRKLQPGCVPTVPMGALIPNGMERFLAAGRIISSDRLANSALRVQATCMATGQAAGAAAALACLRNCEPADIDINDLRKTLKQHHAILPPQ